MKRIRTPISLLLIILLIGGNFLPILAKEDDSTIYINSPEDLYQLARDSAYDIWSRGKTVILKTDLDLRGEEFTPIPIFSGTFDGQGFTIRGLSIKVEGSNQGLFRYLQEDGIIKNLHLEGRIVPQGKRQNIGGLVGNNKGTIENSSFSGLVRGRDAVGGIVGWNNSTGKIISSSAKGVIYGEGRAGGIAGYNGGSILRSDNHISVNTVVEEHELDFTDITIDNLTLRKMFLDAMDLGGIAGLNTGLIQGCENYGSIGYPHVGYNIGGISGRQSGYINKSNNYGKIQGRKDVGGIVGQMEPHISQLVQPSKLRKLQGEVNRLDRKIASLINNMKVSSQLITGDLLEVQEHLDDSQDHISSLIDQVENLINYDIEEINRISLIGAEVLDSMLPILEDITDTMDLVNKATPAIKRAIRDMARAMGEMPHINREIEAIMDILENSLRNIEQGQNYLMVAFKELSSLREIFQEDDLDWAEIIEIIWDREGPFQKGLEGAFENFNKAFERFKEGFPSLKDIGRRIKNIMDSTDYISSNMEDALISILRAIDRMEDAMDGVVDISKDMEKIMEYISDQPALEFATTDDKFQESKEGLFQSMGQVSSSLFKFIETANLQGDLVLNDLETISDQLFRLMNLMLNMIEEMASGELDSEDFLRDVSRHRVEEIVEGKVGQSQNFAKVEGDINVGGIAGGMSIKLSMDPEEDIDLSSRLPVNTVFETKAVIHKCENYGDIVGKKDYIGGIVGRMDLGYIEEVRVNSSIASNEGGYVGGVAGKSSAPIVSAYVKSQLRGKDHIGGIAGLAREIAHSYSLVKISQASSLMGAIAGNVEKDGLIQNNYFVSDSLHGIDGISYGGKAEPIDYQELISLKKIPSFYKDFHLDFIVDGKVIASKTFTYGEPLARIKFPEIPAREGYYSRWDQVDMKDLIFDTEIHGDYIPYLTILESKIKRDQVLSTILVEGLFTEEDTLNVEAVEDMEEFPLDKGDILEQWSLEIADDGQTTRNIRYLPPDTKGKFQIYTLSRNGWKKTAHHWDGKYLVFEVKDRNPVFSVVNIQTAYKLYGIILVISLALILIMVKILGRAKAKAD